jgi:hypothetical protein
MSQKELARLVGNSPQGKPTYFAGVKKNGFSPDVDIKDLLVSTKPPKN